MTDGGQWTEGPKGQERLVGRSKTGEWSLRTGAGSHGGGRVL